ncbi:MAG: hypothetical protein HPZ91_19710 [Lentisphaeria bacterium]|nr:hypothetical protein [Lentisphaeria bacterium]
MTKPFAQASYGLFSNFLLKQDGGVPVLGRRTVVPGNIIRRAGALDDKPGPSSAAPAEEEGPATSRETGEAPPQVAKAYTLSTMKNHKCCISASFARPCARLVNSVSRTLTKPRDFCGNFAFMISHSGNRITAG